MTKRIAQLDGLRGIAALMVVAAHYFGEVASGIEQLRFGWFGVEVFFVLSGFLIGGIIFDERGRDGFWKSFYVRRSARILPLYWVTLIFIFALGAAVSPLAYLTMTQNFAFAFQGDDALYTDPLWTIAVEEQFYLLLPVAICLTPKRFVPLTLVAMFLSAIAFRIIVAPINTAAASMLVFGRMDLLVAGVMAAWALRNLDLKRHLTLIRAAPIPLLFAGSAINFGISFDAFVIYGQSLIALGVAAFVLAIALGAPEFKGFLSSKVMGFFGTISYAVYLLHQPINHLLHRTVLGTLPDIATPQQFALTAASFGLTVLVAWVSWNVFEKHILSAARRYLASSPAKPGLAVVA